MVKSCVIPGCQSGRPADQRKRVTQGLRKRTLFQVPKCQIKRQSWINALKQQLKEDDRICELHFLDSHIVKGVSHLINGKSVFIEHERWRLSDKAIPIENNDSYNKQSIECSQGSFSQKEQVGSQSDQQQCKQNQQFFPVKPEDLQPIEQSELLSDLSPYQIDVFTRQICEQQLIEGQQVYLPETEDLQPTAPQLEQPSISPVLLMGCDEITSKNLTLDEIKFHFSAVLRERWCYYMQSSDLILIHLDTNRFVERIRLRVTVNLSVMMSVVQRQEIILSEHLESFEELYGYMRTAETFTICCGTSFKKNSRLNVWALLQKTRNIDVSNYTLDVKDVAYYVKGFRPHTIETLQEHFTLDGKNLFSIELFKIA